jgi:hypothetical protein
VWGAGRCRNRFTGKLFKGCAVYDSHVTPISHPNDTVYEKPSKCPANRGERYADIFRNVRAHHRQINLSRWLASRQLKLFKELQEHGKLGGCASLTEQKRVPLSLP